MKLTAFLGAAASFLAALALSSCYVTAQGCRYLGILAGARPAGRVLASPDTDAPTRALLETAASVRAYAVGTIGLKDTRSFKSFARVDGNTLTWVVQACAELSFDRHLWDYPFVGKLPYRGYFDSAQAQAESARMKAKGLDVIVRPADAFSSLGWLPDPLFSFMSKYGEYEVADLVIHEMTHATVFVRGRKAGSFNEELATFVGRQGALDFLMSRYGPGSPEAASAMAARKDAATFAAFLRGTARELDALYRGDADAGTKRAGKARIIADRAATYRKEAPGMFTDPGYVQYPMEKANNALLDLYLLYEGEPEVYEKYYVESCGSSLRNFVRTLKDSKDPVALVRGAAPPAGSAPAAPGD